METRPLTLTVRDMGPIAHADVSLGDLTIFVGPQASGKSLVLQTLKAAVDTDSVVETLKRHGYHWAGGERPGPLTELIYGEGMADLIKDATRMTFRGRPWSLHEAGHESWHKKKRRGARVFYIPAQRVLTIQDGWPRPFTSFDIGAPYVVKRFSEDLRVFLENLQSEPLFPARNLLAWAVRWIQASPHFARAFAELFGVRRNTRGLDAVVAAAQTASIRVFAFLHGDDGRGVRTKDISSLDATDEDPDVAGWGGLTDLADRAGEVVARWS